MTDSNKTALQLLDDIIEELKNAVAKVENSDTATKISAKSIPKESGEKGKDKQKGNAGKGNSIDAPKKDDKSSDAPLTVNSIDLRVGVIRSVSKHPTADKLYCEEIDVGEDAPRAIASGLVPFYTLEEMQGRRLVAICNLKPKNLVGFKSNGMVLCASRTNADGSHTVEFVDPPANAKPGDRIVGEGIGNHIEVLTASKCDKSKAFEIVAADLNVDANGDPNWKGHRLVTLDGSPCSVPTIRNAPLH